VFSPSLLGYRPNPMAAGLRTHRSRTIGVVIPDLTNPVFSSHRARHRTHACSGRLRRVVADSDNDVHNARTIINTRLVRQVNGLILATALCDDPIVEECVQRGIPLVLVNRVTDGSVAAVTTDNDIGIRLVVQNLFKRGHRQIAFVGGPQTTSTGHTRYRAFLAATRESRITIDRAIVVNAKSFSEKAGKESLARIFEVAGQISPP
jgi:LacI family transcriptional regulator